MRPLPAVSLASALLAVGGTNGARFAGGAGTSNPNDEVRLAAGFTAAGFLAAFFAGGAFSTGVAADAGAAAGFTGVSAALDAAVLDAVFFGFAAFAGVSDAGFFTAVFLAADLEDGCFFTKSVWTDGADLGVAERFARAVGFVEVPEVAATGAVDLGFAAVAELLEVATLGVDFLAAMTGKSGR